MIRSLFCSVFFLSLFFSANAKPKHKNTVRFYGSNCFYPEAVPASYILHGITPHPLLLAWGQIGGGYERYISKCISIEAGYSRWNNTDFLRWGGKGMPKAVFVPFNNTPTKIGMHERGNLQFYDLSFAYTFLSKKKHQLKGSVALSFQKGYTGYIDSVYEYLGASFPHFQAYGHYEYKEYWGYAPCLSYDFLMHKQWLCIGADVRARRYFNLGNYTQVDVGMHVGVLF